MTQRIVPIDVQALFLIFYVHVCQHNLIVCDLFTEARILSLSKIFLFGFINFKIVVTPERVSVKVLVT